MKTPSVVIKATNLCEVIREGYHGLAIFQAARLRNIDSTEAIEFLPNHPLDCFHKTFRHIYQSLVVSSGDL